MVQRRREKKADRPTWHPAKYGKLLDCPYKEDFVKDMKKAVPGDERRWDPDREMWWISDGYLDEVEILLFHYFEDAGIGRDD